MKNYDGAAMWFNGNQLPPYILNSSKTDLKKKASLEQKQKSP